MTAQDRQALKRYCQSIINNPAPLDGQPHTREGMKLWCKDWEIIEVLKCLFLGTSTYRADPPPRRLKQNPLWDQQAIISKAEALSTRCDSVEAMIEVLKAERSAYA
jgi:hypothetical protein